jgi:hypothetical protein
VFYQKPACILYGSRSESGFHPSYKIPIGCGRNISSSHSSVPSIIVGRCSSENFGTISVKNSKLKVGFIGKSGVIDLVIVSISAWGDGIDQLYNYKKFSTIWQLLESHIYYVGTSCYIIENIGALPVDTIQRILVRRKAASYIYGNCCSVDVDGKN